MARKLSEEFINELKEGKFRPVLQAVLDDDSLDLELRGDCVIIYYRGGKLLTLNSNGTFEALDSNYHESTTFLNIVPCLDKLEDYILRAKKIIDNYITHAKKKNHLGEKEIQQMIIRENNYSPTDIDASTDFFIIDTEYKDSSSNGQFDIIALQWNSTSSDHKQKNVELAFIEVKQGFKSVSTKSGLLKHISDYKKFTNSSTLPKPQTFPQAVFLTLELIPGWHPNAKRVVPLPVFPYLLKKYTNRWGHQKFQYIVWLCDREGCLCPEPANIIPDGKKSFSFGQPPGQKLSEQVKLPEHPDSCRMTAATTSMVFILFTSPNLIF